jgi:hypothetical protein
MNLTNKKKWRQMICPFFINYLMNYVASMRVYWNMNLEAK